MAWEIEELPTAEGMLADYRVFVTDGKESFVVERTVAQRLADLLNDGAKTVRVNKANTK